MPGPDHKAPESIELRYGENSDQTPAQYCPGEDSDPLALHKFELLEGKMGYNNFCDLDRLLQTFTHLAAGFLKKRGVVPTIVLIAKHGNCCGAAYGTPEGSADTCMRAGLGDTIAAFGGFAFTNHPLSEMDAVKLLEHIQGQKLDGVVAPWFGAGARERFHRKGDACKLLTNPSLRGSGFLDTSPRFRHVRGGRLEQPNYTHVLDFATDVTCYGPARKELEDDILLAWGVGATSNSNTITLAKKGNLLANAVGQQDRVGAVALALWRAGRAFHETEGAVAYSDGFFPFPDAVELLIDAGVKAILAPKGSINDKKTIELCEQKDVTLYLTPYRGFFNH